MAYVCLLIHFARDFTPFNSFKTIWKKKYFIKNFHRKRLQQKLEKLEYTQWTVIVDQIMTHTMSLHFIFYFFKIVYDFMKKKIISFDSKSIAEFKYMRANSINEKFAQKPTTILNRQSTPVLSANVPIFPNGLLK